MSKGTLRGGTFTLTQVAGHNLEDGPANPSLTVTTEERFLGSGEDVHVRIPLENISARHAVVRLENGAATIHDLDSTSGTYLNFARVKKPTGLKRGDLVSLGRDVVFLVGTTGSNTDRAEAAPQPEQRADTLETPQPEPKPAQPKPSQPKPSQPKPSEPTTAPVVHDAAQKPKTPPARSSDSEKPTADLPAVVTLASPLRMDLVNTLLERIDPIPEQRLLLTVALQELESALGAERLYVYLLPGSLQTSAGENTQSYQINELQQLEVAARRGRSTSTVEPSAALLRRALQSHTPTLLADTTKPGAGQPAFAYVRPGLPARSVICTSIRNSLDAVGVLYVDRPRASAGSFELNDAHLAAVVARFIGARLELFQLRQDLRLWVEAHEQLSHACSETLPGVGFTLESHLNRLDLLANQAEEAHGTPLLANMLRAESAHTRQELADFVRWSQGHEDALIDPLLPEDHAPERSDTGEHTATNTERVFPPPDSKGEAP